MMDSIAGSVLVNLFSDLIGVAAGILFSYLVYRYYISKKYGGWTVLIKRGGETLVNRNISPRKARDILEESSELSVYLKGVASPYGWINCDIIEDGKKLGLLTIDPTKKCYVIDLDKNPTPKTPSQTQPTAPSSTSLPS